MSKHARASHPIYNLLPTEIEGFDSLAELALDLRWSWNHATDHVWRQLDPALWKLTHNPWVVLQTVSRDRIERVLDDPAFRKHVDDLVQTRRDAAAQLTQVSDDMLHNVFEASPLERLRIQHAAEGARELPMVQTR